MQIQFCDLQGSEYSGRQREKKPSGGSKRRKSGMEQKSKEIEFVKSDGW